MDEVGGDKEVEKEVKDEVDIFKCAPVKVKEEVDEVDEVDIVEADFADEHLIFKTECCVDEGLI